MSAASDDEDQARLLRKVRRMNARAEAARLRREQELLEQEAASQRASVAAATRVQALGGNASLRSTTDFIAALHVREEAYASVSAVAAELDATAELQRVAAAMDSAPPSPRLHDDPEAAEAEATARRLAPLLRPYSGHVVHPQRWVQSKPGRWLLERKPAGTGAADLTLLPQTHGDTPGVPWMPVGRRHEVVPPPPAKERGVTGTWRGHAHLDEDAQAHVTLPSGTARLKGLQGAELGVTSGSATRFQHDPIPSHTLGAAAFTKTGTAVPQALLSTLTREQRMAPRHPAYLLDATAHHPAPWRRPKPAKDLLFSEPPRNKAATLNEQLRARVAMVPDRSLPSADPRNRGEPAYITSLAPQTYFSRVALDAQWLELHDAEVAGEQEQRFWAAAEERSKPYRPPGEDGEEELGEGGGLSSSLSAPADGGFSGRLTGSARRSGSDSRRGGAGVGSGGGWEPNARTFAASSATGVRSVLGRPRPSGSDAPASTLLVGPHGKFQPLRSALAFAHASDAQAYEEARRALAAREPMGAKTLHKHTSAALADLEATETRLASQGVNTGLGLTGRGTAVQRHRAASAAAATGADGLARATGSPRGVRIGDLVL